ncbi:MAG: hypothetical protein J5755_00290 [Clostridia bacterium]|nr:hypothetical protein [Clostridia bacterium]
MCFKKNDPTKDPVKPTRMSGPITSFALFNLRLSGMRAAQIYEIVPHGDLAEVSLYRPRYDQHDPDGRVLEEQVTCPMGRVLALLNDCSVLKWDGFDGPHPKGVLDGTMFRFQLDLGDGRVVTAHGSENFPSHFHDLTAGLYAIFREQGKDGHL